MASSISYTKAAQVAAVAVATDLYLYQGQTTGAAALGILSIAYDQLPSIDVTKKAIGATCEKLSYVAGYAIMRLSQYVYGRSSIQFPQTFKDKVIEASDKDLDDALGVLTSHATAPIFSLVYEAIDPLQRGFSAETSPTKDWLETHQPPRALLSDTFKEFRNFMLESRLFDCLKYYGHSISYDSVSGKMYLLVNNRPQCSDVILKKFSLENRAIQERFFVPPFIVNRKTGRKYAYLDKGLVPHDVEKDFMYYKKLPESHRPLQPILQFKTRKNVNFDSPEGAQETVLHSWVQIVQPSGKCYSFGMYGQGVVQSPDFAEYAKKDIYTVEFPLTKPQLKLVFGTIRNLRLTSREYHFTKNNCTLLPTEIASVLQIRALKQNKLKDYNSFINRIRLYAVSSLLAEQIRSPAVSDNIIAVKQLATLVHEVSLLPIHVDTMVKKFSLPHAFQSIALKNHFEKIPGQKKMAQLAFNMFKKTLSSFDLELSSRLIDALSLITPAEWRDLCASLVQGSKRELTHKIFHHLEDFFFRKHAEYGFDNPESLRVALEKIVKKMHPSHTPLSFKESN